MVTGAIRSFVTKHQSVSNGSKIIFSRKPTSIEVRLAKLGASLSSSREEAYELFGVTNDFFHRSWMSHERQLKNCRLVLEGLEEPVIIEPDDIFAQSETAIKALSSPSFVVVCGGDEYVKSVIRLCSSESKVLAINSDPMTSRGVCAVTLDDIVSWKEGKTEIPLIPWRKIEARLDSKFIGCAMDTIFIGDARQLTRTRLDSAVFSSDSNEIKFSCSKWDCNYLLVNTGLGSTGWVLSAARDMCPVILQNSLEEEGNKNLELYVSQPYQGRKPTVLMVPSQKLSRCGFVEIQSLMNDVGICVVGNNIFPLGRGEKVLINLKSLEAELYGVHNILEDTLSLTSNFLYVGNRAKHLMSRYIVRLYNESYTLIVEEEQQSSGIFLAPPEAAFQSSKLTCCIDDLSTNEHFVFKSSDKRFDLLVVGNIESSPEITGDVHRIISESESLLLSSDESLTVALDAYHQFTVEPGQEIELYLGSQCVQVFGLHTLS